MASTEIIRHVMASGVQRIPVCENGLVGTLFVPAGTERHPGILVLGGSEGGLMEGRAALLASHGYAACALAYFGKDHLPKQLINISLEYIGKAISWVQAQPSVLSDRLAVLGTSKGGELALICGSTFSQIRAVIAVVPSGTVLRGIGKLADGSISSSWSMNGVPLPYACGSIPLEVTEEVNRRRTSGEGIVYREWYLSQLSDPDSLKKAAIPVEISRGRSCSFQVAMINCGRQIIFQRW